MKADIKDEMAQEEKIKGRQDIKDLLTQHDFFNEMDEEMIEVVMGCGILQHYKPAEYLGKENEPADHLFVIRKGKIAIQIPHPSKGDLTISTIGAGEVAGFSWIIAPYKLQFNLKAMDHTSVIALDGLCLRKKCEEDHHLGYLLMKSSAQVMQDRLFSTRVQLIDVYV